MLSKTLMPGCRTRTPLFTEESMKRRWILTICIAGALAIAVLITGSLLFTDPISVESFAKLKQGMTEEEVEAVLGPPSEIKDFRAFSVTIKLQNRDGISYREGRQIS